MAEQTALLSERPSLSAAYYDCTAQFLRKENGTITALSTLLLTVVTSLLAWVARQQFITTRAQLRAYVWVRGGRVHDVAVQKIPYAMLEVRNVGQTPAHDFEITTGCLVYPYPLPSETPFPATAQAGLGTRMVLHPNAEPPFLSAAKWAATPEQSLAGLSAEQRDMIMRSNEVRLYAFAIASYRDVFGKKHKTSFCASIDLGGFSRGEDGYPPIFEGAPIHNTAT